MIAGNNAKAFYEDAKHNITLDQIKQIATLKKMFKQKAGQSFEERVKGVSLARKKEIDLMSYMDKHMEDTILPSIYNEANGYASQTDFYNQTDGTEVELLKSVSDVVSITGEGAKYEEGDPLNKTISSFRRYFENQITEEASEKETEEEQEAISKNTHSQDEDPGPDPPKKNPLVKMKGYKELLAWLEKMQTDKSTQKKYQQITKLSDLQKVSAVEFVKPKAILMKKIVNKEFWCKQVVEGERFMHTMIDRSGSMGDYTSHRNALMEQVFDDCQKMKINLENTFWNCNLCKDKQYGLHEIKTKKELVAHVLETSNGGSDNMGYCVLEKLSLLKKQQQKQYLLCISDGTGSIDSDSQSRQILDMASSKNVELRFALFSRNNEVYEIPKEHIFYIYN